MPLQITPGKSNLTGHKQGFGDGSAIIETQISHFTGFLARHLIAMLFTGFNQQLTLVSLVEMADKASHNEWQTDAAAHILIRHHDLVSPG